MIERDRSRIEFYCAVVEIFPCIGRWGVGVLGRLALTFCNKSYCGPHEFVYVPFFIVN